MKTTIFALSRLCLLTLIPAGLGCDAGPEDQRPAAPAAVEAGEPALAPAAASVSYFLDGMPVDKATLDQAGDDLTLVVVEGEAGQTAVHAFTSPEQARAFSREQAARERATQALPEETLALENNRVMLYRNKNMQGLGWFDEWTFDPENGSVVDFRHTGYGNINNATSAVINLTSHDIFLYQFPHYAGRKLTVRPDQTIRDLARFDFDDRPSSMDYDFHP